MNKTNNDYLVCKYFSFQLMQQPILINKKSAVTGQLTADVQQNHQGEAEFYINFTHIWLNQDAKITKRKF